MGVGSLFYAMYIMQILDGVDTEATSAAFPIISFIVLSSVLIHGITVPIAHIVQTDPLGIGERTVTWGSAVGWRPTSRMPMTELEVAWPDQDMGNGGGSGGGDGGGRTPDEEGEQVIEEGTQTSEKEFKPTNTKVDSDEGIGEDISYPNEAIVRDTHEVSIPRRQEVTLHMDP